MSEVVNMHQAKTSLSRLVERALAGEDVVIARNGEPLVWADPEAEASRAILDIAEAIEAAKPTFKPLPVLS